MASKSSQTTRILVFVSAHTYKQLISNFEAEIAVESKQLEAQPKNGVAYIKNSVANDVRESSQ